MTSYEQSIRAAAERHGWSVREEPGAIVVTDGRSTVRHRLGGAAEDDYVHRLAAEAEEEASA